MKEIRNCCKDTNCIESTYSVISKQLSIDWRKPNHKRLLSVEIPKIKSDPIRPSSNYNLGSKKIVLANKKMLLLSPPIQIPCKLISKLPLMQNLQSPKQKSQNFPELNPSLSVNGKNSFACKQQSKKAYLKMLEFYIKIKVEYGPIFAKLDKEKKNWIPIEKLKNYLNAMFPEAIEPLKHYFEIVIFINKSEKVQKESFLASCAVVRYDNSIDNFRDVLIKADYCKVNTCLTVLWNFFLRISTEGLIETYYLKILYKPTGQLEKCFNMICSKPLDFSRFLRFFPLFLEL